MPEFFGNTLVVTKEELEPWYSYDAIHKNMKRYRNNEHCGLKKVSTGGNGRRLLISYDSLPVEIQNALGDPRKLDHILDRYYEVDTAAVRFYQLYRFEQDGSYLDTEFQERYIVNASVLKAAVKLREERIIERKSKGKSLTGLISTVWSDVVTFQDTLRSKYHCEHTLPCGEKQFKNTLKAFETTGYAALVSKKLKTKNAIKVTDETLNLLKALFVSDKHKPGATEVHRRYNSFLSGYVDVVNADTGVIYNPEDFKKLSESTVKRYLSEWAVRIGTHAVRSGDRQKFMQLYQPWHSFKKVEFAGSIISVDDRQPAFKMHNGKRIWFYNAIDIGSEAFTCWVYGKTKEGIILDFYRQLVRNYHEWGFSLPAEIEAELSLNSKFKESFLRPGNMFEYVHIEANRARAKRIENYYRSLRYDYEKYREGWLSRPSALSEANQASADNVPTLDYDQIVDGCISDIEKWNNTEHSRYKGMSRWEVFTQMQNPNLKPTNYLGILPNLGYHTETSCNVGIIRLQGEEYLLGDGGMIATGAKLINYMKKAEGKEVDIYWLDDNNGKVFKALIFLRGQYICEAVRKPEYARAMIERTPLDETNRQLMKAYVATITSFGKKQKGELEEVVLIDNREPDTNRNIFKINRERRPSALSPSDAFDIEVLEHSVPEEAEEQRPGGFVKNMFDRF